MPRFGMGHGGGGGGGHGGGGHGGGGHHGGGGGRGGGGWYGPGWGWGPGYWDPGYADPVVIINNAGVPGSAAAVAPAVSAAVQQATASATTPAQAQAQLAKLKRSLTAWLDYRGRLDEIIAGKRTGKDAAGAVGATQAAKRPKVEQPLATHLYNLLSEVFDPSALPNPSIAANPTAAVQLAQIAISGQLPGTAATPTATSGMPWWFWPMAVGGVLLAVAIVSSNAADVAKNQAQLDCIAQGACTDSSFWLKWGAIAVGVWFVWDWLGVGARLQGVARRRRR